MADELPKELFVAFDGNSIRTFLKYLKDTANEVTLEARRCSVRHRRLLGSTVGSDDRAHRWDHRVPNQKCQILSTYRDNLPAVSNQVSGSGHPVRQGEPACAMIGLEIGAASLVMLGVKGYAQGC